MYDCIIIGKGPAGISAAIYLKRLNYNVLVIGRDFGSLAKAEKIENYYGFESISGIDLANLGVKQANRLGIDVLTEEVIEITDLTIKTNKNTYTAKSIFLATGLSTNPNIKGIDKANVSFCAICDGFFYRNKKLAIIGSGDLMIHEKSILENFTKDITIFTNNNDASYDNQVSGVIEGISILDDKKIISVNNKKYEFDQVFIAIKSDSNSLAKHMGLIMKDNKIVVDNYKTNIKGVFAGGDITLGFNQVSRAVADGANASIAINKFLKSE